MTSTKCLLSEKRQAYNKIVAKNETKERTLTIFNLYNTEHTENSDKL